MTVTSNYRVLLVGNYRADQQMSMVRYHDWLLREFRQRGILVETIEPPAILGKITAGPLTKWLRYIDKYLLFPPMLVRRIRRLGREAKDADSKLLIHITDHSNAPYLTSAGGHPIVVTCHDLLAVRGALGEDTDCPASGFGKLLQAKILSTLRRADLVVCVSTATRNDLARLAPETPSTVIPLALNQTYGILSREETASRLPPGLVALSYVLHVGSSLARKNREGILRIFARVADRFSGPLVFAGENLHPAQRALAADLGIAGRVVEIPNPPGSVIEALYNGAHAFLFPSKTEGFGWPVIEAQACGCPVLAARTTSLPEVVGEGGWMGDLADEAGFADALVALQSASVRAETVRKGLLNLQRFENNGVIASYLSAYAGLTRVDAAENPA